MIKDEQIVCVTFTNWEANYVKSTVELMTYFAQQNKVLFVDFPYSIANVFQALKGDKKIPLKRLLGFENRVRPFTTAQNSTVYVLTTLPVLPINWLPKGFLYNCLLRVNSFIVALSIKKAMKQLSINQPIVVNAFNPYLGLGLQGKLHEKLLLYYGYDNIKDVSWSRGHGGYLEERFIKKVDAAVFSSDALYQDKKDIGAKAFVVKNGVDFDLFYKAGEVVPQNARKKIGYIGSIDKKRIDVELLHYLATQAPDLDFEFVGRDVSDDHAFKHLPNVVFHGAKAPTELPAFMQTFDVVIIPFLRTSLTRMIYPMKINEYLAAAKPVVMTNFATLPEFEGVVQVESTHESFLAAIRKAITSDTTEQRTKGIAIAKSNSWQKRAEAFSEVIENVLIKK